MSARLASVRVSRTNGFSPCNGVFTALSGLLAPASGSASLPAGTLGMSLSLQVDISDYGGSVTVTKPVATSTLPASGGWSGMLGLPSGASL